MIEALIREPLAQNEIEIAQEDLRRRVRVVLREMSDLDWRQFKDLFEKSYSHPTRESEIRILELVFRVGESVSNIEIAAAAKAAALSGRRLLDPDVARRNALIKARIPGTSAPDPEAAYSEAKRALEEAKAIADRAKQTLAYALAEPTTPFKHARNTVFRVVDAILAQEVLRNAAFNIEAELAAVPPVSREKMRWALYRMPADQQRKLIDFVPLNTVLMFQPGEDPTLQATRDRRLAHDLFVAGQSEEELVSPYHCSLPAIKSAIGVILDRLVSRPLARQLVNDYLARVERIAPMGTDEVRKSLKRLTAKQRAELLNRVPACAWKLRDVMCLHKRLFLDYLSGDWVLGALVNHYNLRGEERLSGTFHCDGRLTVRGAAAAITGLLTKISEEPELRQELRVWSSNGS
jgi:hypothetical protein